MNRLFFNITWKLSFLYTLLLVFITSGCTDSSTSADDNNDSVNGESLQLELIWEYQADFQTFTVLYDKQQRPYFYAVNRAGGLLIFNAAEPENPQLIKTIPTDDFNSKFTNNLFQSGDYLYVAIGNFMGNPQQTPGLAIVDISTPENAFVSGIWEYNKGTRGAHVVEVKNNYAYLGGSFEGLIILDVSNANDIRFVSQLVPDINFPKPNPPPLQVPAARGLTLVDDNLLILAYDAGGIRMIDISDKQNPVELSRYINPAINPDVQAQAYNNVVVNGNTAYITVDYCGVEIVDMTDPSVLQQTAWWDPWECEGDPLNWFRSPGHASELVLIPDQNRLFISAGDIELVVLDVSDSENPELIATYGEEDNNRVAWGLDATNSHIYLAHIASPGGPFTSNWAGIAVLSY